MPPPPPPGPQEEWESDEQFTARVAAHNLEQQLNRDLLRARVSGFREGYEAGLWELAPVVVLAEIVSKGKTSPESSRFGVMPQVTLKVVKVAKGAPEDTPFRITYAGIGSCGPVGMVSVVDGEVGDRFAIFAKERGLSMGSIITGVSEDEARYARTKNLIASD